MYNRTTVGLGVVHFLWQTSVFNLCNI